MIYAPWAWTPLGPPPPPKVGRPHRDRSKVKAGRKAARRNR